MGQRVYKFKIFYFEYYNILKCDCSPCTKYPSGLQLIDMLFITLTLLQLVYVCFLKI